MLRSVPVLLAIASALLTPALHAAGPDEVVGWWRMEAAIGQKLAGQTLPDASGTGGHGEHPGTVRTWDGGLVQAFHELPGRYIYDPLTGKAHENQSSLRFQSSKQDQGAGTSDYIQIDSGIDQVKPKSFTIEGFMLNATSVDKWHSLICLRKPSQAHPHAWSLSTENQKGAKRLRYGGHKAPKGFWGHYTSNPSVNQGGWHHFAYVFDGSGEANVARLYWDGQLVSETSGVPDPAWESGQQLFIGGGPGSAGWNGYFDEVRYTAAALTPEQFLQASDTPGKPDGPATAVALGLRTEPLKPLQQPVSLADLPQLQVGPARVHVPSDANLINVKDRYGAAGDGKTDDTAAIKRAVAENVGKHRTLYFPPGTYVISEPIPWKSTNDTWNAFLTWQGAGMGQTFIYLRPGAIGFGSAEDPQAVTTTGSIPGMGGSNPVTGGGNRAHNNYIMDMTFVIGKDNPGAVGVDFNASNTGAIVNVRIIAQGPAVEGLRLTRQVGCLLIKNVEVHGFDTGIRAAGDLYGSTLTHIHIRGQKKVGLHNTGHNLAIEQLVSDNAVTAIINDGETDRFEDTGLLTLVDSRLIGGAADHPAIDNQTAAVLRNVQTQGYSRAVQQINGEGVSGGQVSEYVWPEVVTLFESTPRRTADLPIVAPPQASEATPDEWVSVAEFLPADEPEKADRSEAIQKAIDSGAKVVYFPIGSYRVYKPVVVRGNVQRLIGYQSWLLGPDEDGDEKGLIVFENTQPVAMDRFNTKRMAVDIRSDKPVAFSHLMSMPDTTLTHPKASVFSENVVAGHVALGPGQSWRAWQLNIEKGGPPAMVDNRGGTFCVLGYKTEKGNTVLHSRDGGKSEILGGLWYPAQGFGKGKDPVPALIVENSDVSVSFTDMCKGGGQYQVLAEESRDGTTKKLPRSALQRTWGQSGSVSLYRASN